MASLLDKSLLSGPFRTMKRDEKVIEYEKLIDMYNKQLSTNQQLKLEVAELKTYKNFSASLREVVNKILSRFEIPDRLDKDATLANDLANILWKLYVHKTRAVPKL